MLLRRALSRAIVCLVGATVALTTLLSFRLTSAHAFDQGMTAVWRGKYQCGQGLTGVDVSIHANEDGSLAAKLKFYPVPENPKVPAGEFQMFGRFDQRSRRVELRPAMWISRPAGYSSYPLSGELDGSGQRITGRVRGPRCTTFSLTRTSEPVPDAVAQLRHDRSARAQAPPTQRVAGAQQGPRPELSSKPVAVSSMQEFTYTDAAMTNQGKADLGVEPIDQLNQWLFDNRYKCIDSLTVNVGASGPPSQVPIRHFGSKRYVVHCSGECQGLNYSVASHHRIWHFGVSQPYPVLEIKSMTLGYGTVTFNFLRSNPQGSATVVVSQWSGDTGDYGGGCKDTMFQQPQ
jgi:hypothetical protein